MSDQGAVKGEHLEVVKPCGEAWAHMKSVLFPFDLGKWFILGFVAWLALLGAGGGVNLNIGNPFGPRMRRPLAGAHSPRQMFERGAQYVETHWPLILAIAAVGAVVFLAIYVGLSYLRARGTFMYLDCVFRGKAEVVEPWRRARKHAWSFFGWQLLIGLTGGVLALAVIGIACAATWHDLRSLTFSPQTVTTFVAMGALFLAVLFLFGILQWLLRNLVAPIMFLRDIPGRQAWSEFFALARGHVRAFILYWLMNVALGLLYGVLAFPVVCCTCCIGALPVIHQTILQPLLFWMRAYPFFFLAQFGGPYHAPGIVPAAPQPPAAPKVAACPPDVRRACPPDVWRACPQCGQQHQIPGGQPGTYTCVKCGATFEV